MAGNDPRSTGELPGHDPRRLLTSLRVVVYDWDVASDALLWGPNAADVLGEGAVAGWTTGRAFSEAVDSCGGAARADAVLAATGSDDGTGVPFACLYRLATGRGAAVQVDDTGRWFAGEDGTPARVHGTIRFCGATSDTADLSQTRSAFLEQVGQDIADGREAGKPLTLFALAIANLSELNDELGFEATDRLIDTVSARLGGAMRRRDRFVRYSGNRFALGLRGCGPDEAHIAAARLLQLVTAEPFGTAGGSVAVKLAVGAASAPLHALEPGLLLRRAEGSLGLAKRRAAQPFMMYDAKLFRAAPRSRRDPLLDGIDVLNARRVALALQPVVSAGTRETVFQEALFRVLAEDGAVRPAGDVIPSLERAGLVHLADNRMLELAADHLARFPTARLSLNVSPLTMERPDWLPALSAHLSARPGIASRLIVEVTETAAIRDPGAMRGLLEAIKALGAAVAIDDFGAGYTSFRNLRALPVDFVKIDGAFVQNLSRSSDDRFFVRTLIDLARHLGIRIVAEWVEDEESALLLAAWGADFLQGDHCGEPMLVRPAPVPAPAPASRVAV